MRSFKKFIDQFNRGLLAVILVVAQLTPLFFAAPASASSISSFNQYDNVGLDWQNGNLQADLFEGDSVPFRAYLDGLTAGPHTLQIAYDNVSSSKHAYDYLTSYDRSFAPDPCVSVLVGCVAGTPGSIPAEPTLPGFVSQAGGVVDVFAPSGDSATVTSVVYASTPGHDLASGNLQTVVNINFTTDGDEVVLAWGGHIALESEWGIASGASAINGSPYHMRIGSDGLDGQGGSQDRSMKASSVTLFPRITINKVVDGGDAQASDFSFNISPSINGQSVYNIASGETSVTIFDVQPDGDYTITENQAPGYSFSFGNGVENCEFSGDTATASVAAGTASQVEHAECTFTNSQLPSSIKIIKNTVGGDGTFDFTSDFGVSQLTTTAGTASQTVNNVQPGVYSISETVPSGWNLDSATCNDGSPVSIINLEAGEDIICTFTNTKQGSIKIIKNTVGGDGTFDFTSDFGVSQLTTTAGTASQTENNLNPGKYSISETIPSGWDLTSSSCDDGSDPASIDLAAAESVTCTFTNTKRGSITIVKNTSGGDDTFNFISNFGVSSLATSGGTASQTVNNLVPGSNYNISETVPDGWFLDAEGCDNGTTDAVLVAAGQTTTCTFSNIKFGNITGFKYEVDSDGSNPAGLAGWTINLLNDNQEVIDSTVTDGTGQYAFNLLKPGDYEVVEILQDSWTQIDNDDTCEGKYEINLTAGVTSDSNDFCNFKNGSITGYKWHDLNADGNVSSEPKLAGWTIFIDENDNQTLDNGEISKVTDGNGDYSFTNLSPGTYVICEVNQPGWVQTFPTTQNGCRNAVIDQSDESLSGKNYSFGNQAQGTLTVVKDVVNDDGGNLTFADFSFKINDGTEQFFTQTVNEDGQAVFTGLPVGDYTVVEIQENSNGYSTNYSVDCQPAPVVVNQNVTCTITNDDNGPSLRFTKRVLNDDGGTKLAVDFQLYVNGNPVSFGAGGGPVEDNTAFGNLLGAEANTAYTVTEDTENGYTQVGETECVDMDTNFPVLYPVILALGQNVNCTITNDDQPATLILVKDLPNDDGGQATEDEFNVYIDGSASTWGQHTVDAGTYTVSEDTKDGYTASDWYTDCSANGEVTLLPGETKTCTITNDDVAPTLTVYKVVENDNSGDKVGNDFNIRIDDTAFDMRKSETYGTKTTYMAKKTLLANTDYSLAEDDLEGYLEGNWYCSNQSEGEFDGITLNLSVAEDLTCWIENDDTPNPSINVIKDGPTTAQAGQTVKYTFTVTNTGDVALNELTVNDSITGIATYVSGDENNDNILDLYETWIYEAEYIIPEDQTSSVDNTVTACGYEVLKLQLSISDQIVRAVALQSVDETAEEPVKTQVCDEDTHSATVPQVLAEVVELEETGQEQISVIVAGLSVILTTAYVARKSYRDEKNYSIR